MARAIPRASPTRARVAGGIHAVARDVGLSVSTVSRALNGYADVSERTRERVLEAAQRLSYVPSAVGLQLRRGSTRSVGFLITPGAEFFIEPFHQAILGSLDRTLREGGLDLVVSTALPGPDEEARCHRLVQARRVDALIFARTRPDDWRIRYLHEQGFPFVAFGTSDLPFEYPYVEIDLGAAIRQACERLHGFGHRRVALVHGPLTFNFSHRIVRAWRDAVRDLGLVADHAFAVETNLGELDGHRAASALLALPAPPTAIVCASDAVAFGVMQRAREVGVAVGRELSVIGCDDSRIAPMTEPPLTTFSSPSREVGAALGEMVLRLLAGERPDPVTFRPTLVERSSDGPPRASPVPPRT